MLNSISLITLVAIAALLIRSGFRIWRLKNSFLKWGGAVLAAMLGVAVSSVSTLLIVGQEISEPIPWCSMGRMDDEELSAVYEYLTHLPGS
jgi:hypothetical protein